METPSKMISIRCKKKKIIWTGIGILFFIIIIVCIVLYLVYFFFFRKIYYPEDQIVICLGDIEELTKKNKAQNDIILEDCTAGLVDYDNVKGTVLYLSDMGDLLEFEVKTGDVNRLNILKQVDDAIAGEKKENLHNLKYGPGEGEISFTSRENGLFVCRESQDKADKVTDCVVADKKNTYEWVDENKVYIILYEGNMWDNLYLWENSTGTKEQIERSIVSFTLSDDKKKIYGISLTAESNGITIEMNYSIYEMNTETGTWRKLADLDTESNFLLEMIDDRYLIFVEERYTQKKSKVYCLDIETGKKKCIYKTKSEVVGIIWTGDD